MAYISAIAVDFGSTNSGCCRISSFDSNGNLTYAAPAFLHDIGNYAKDNTWFYVEPSFLERLRTDYDSLSDDDFRIESRVFANTQNPNIIWGRDAIRHHAQFIIDNNWVAFKRFKMMLYSGEENYIGIDFPLLTIIKTFLRILKIECLALESRRMERPVSADEIMWGLTIPSIWSEDNKRVMLDVAHEVFTPLTRILSEPEGPLVYSLLVFNEQGRVDFRSGRTAFVVDLGGGTTDICLMREAQDESGNYRIEMVANTDGSAAGGNDIDNNFYKYLLRFISRGQVDDNGIAYDTLSDDDLYKTLFADFQNRIDLFLDFEDNWYLLKNRNDINNITECPFTFTSGYRRWLIDNGHNRVASIVGDYLMDGCHFPKDEFVEQVFNPTFDKICDKVSEILMENQNIVNIDRIVLAGGLACNYLLDSRLRATISTVLGEQYKDKFDGMGRLMKGGAIMAGANYMLLHRDVIVRLAKKNYYYDSCIDKYHCTLRMIDEYKNWGIVLKMGEVSNMMADESEYSIIFPNGTMLALSPIAIKGMLVKNYSNDHLYTSEGQTNLSVTLYSSDNGFIVFANPDNPQLYLEADLKFDCRPDCRYKLEVDFNEAQVSNALHYIFSEYESGEIVKEGYVSNAVIEQ